MAVLEGINITKSKIFNSSLDLLSNVSSAWVEEKCLKNVQAK
jgi:hypothetical protein